MIWPLTFYGKWQRFFARASHLCAYAFFWMDKALNELKNEWNIIAIMALVSGAVWELKKCFVLALHLYFSGFKKGTHTTLSHVVVSFIGTMFAYQWAEETTTWMVRMGGDRCSPISTQKTKNIWSTFGNCEQLAIKPKPTKNLRFKWLFYSAHGGPGGWRRCETKVHNILSTSTQIHDPPPPKYRA